MLIVRIQVPQLAENYRGQNAEGISLRFLGIWMVGDLTNLVGAVYGGLLPTVVALAAYFCLADAILIAQCLYYKYVTRHRAEHRIPVSVSDDPNQPLLQRKNSDIGLPESRRQSSASQGRRDSVLVNPALPVVVEDGTDSRAWAWNTISIVLVCLVGTLGWTLAWKAGLW